MQLKVLYSICNMAAHGLPDMFTLSPRACDPHASGVHIRQTTSAHVINTKCILPTIILALLSCLYIYLHFTRKTV